LFDQIAGHKNFSLVDGAQSNTALETLQCRHFDRKQDFFSPGCPANEAMSAIDKVHHAGWSALVGAVDAHLSRLRAHPSRSVLLLPFFQLQAVARSQLRAWPHLFVPRIETTQSWASRVAIFQPDALDLSFDAALDQLRARQWLAKAGLQAKTALLAPLLLEESYLLAHVAASVPPAERQSWAAGLRQSSFAVDAASQSFAHYEAAVSRIALEWAAASSYATDVLFQEVQRLDALVVVRGVQDSALAQRLLQICSDKALVLDLPQSGLGVVHEHPAADFENQAQRAACCIAQHVQAGRTPVALPAIDRQATRRISALLLEQGLAVSDETGWRLSTTRAAAALMSLLRAAQHDATPDELLDALKHSNAPASQVQAWEDSLRGKKSVKTQIAVENISLVAIKIGANNVVNEAAIPASDWLHRLRKPRTAQAWLHSLQAALEVSGLWAKLSGDEAGQLLIDALHLQSTHSVEDGAALSLTEFTQWVQAVSEAKSFKPSLRADAFAQVIITPLAQLAARPFAAAVLAGVDETNLSASPALPGRWSRAQRQSIGLPSREQLAQEQSAAWAYAMQIPQVDVLWSHSASGPASAGQTQQASPLLLHWKRSHEVLPGVDERAQLRLPTQAQHRPAPSAAVLALSKFSASSYADVRACPYRYFALRLLGLSESNELDESIEKRDFGSWLHLVLSDFHQQRSRETSASLDRQLLDACAATREQEQFAGDAGFIPFAASWPQVRDSYLQWLSEHEKNGWRFEASELEAKHSLGALALQGRLDRVDVLSGSGAQTRLVIDYKTENAQALKERVAQPLEDTQLAFYATLLGAHCAERSQNNSNEANIQASYLAISEKNDAKLINQSKLVHALPIFMQGLQADATRVAAGHTLPALGEGSTCDYCSARGLCRKDMWETA
jgi:ATP-dependent helicase/nuclease subunit B